MINLIAKPSFNERHHKSLIACWKEGVLATVMVTVADVYFIPLALLVGASSKMVGLLVAIPNLLGSISQLISVRLLNRMGSRHRFLIPAILLQVFVLISAATLPLLHFSFTVAAVIFLASLYRILANLVSTVWGSLVSDYLAPEERGTYFGWRSQLVGIASVISMTGAGIMLYMIKPISNALAFFLIFIIAAVIRFISVTYISKMEDIPLQIKTHKTFNFFNFIARYKKGNFVKFVFYISAMSFGASLSGPFFSVYMIRDLNFTHLMFMAINLASILGGFIAGAVFGKLSDKIGNAKVLKMIGYIVPFTPILWMCSTSILWLFFVEILAGFSWGGFGLCAANFTYDAVKPENRVQCISYLTLINGFAIFFGATFGGYLTEILPPVFGQKLFGVFLISSAVRLLVTLTFGRQFKETRESIKKNLEPMPLFSVLLGYGHRITQRLWNS